MPHFFVKLIAPRPKFHEDIEPHELEVMQRHFAYWLEHTQNGTGVVFGPVFEPEAPYGMGIVETATIEEAEALVEADPAVAEGVMASFTVVPMRVGMVRATAAPASAP